MLTIQFSSGGPAYLRIDPDPYRGIGGEHYLCYKGIPESRAIVVDLDRDRRLVGIEFLDRGYLASAFAQRTRPATYDRLGYDGIAPVDVLPDEENGNARLVVRHTTRVPGAGRVVRFGRVGKWFELHFGANSQLLEVQVKQYSRHIRDLNSAIESLHGFHRR